MKTTSVRLWLCLAIIALFAVGCSTAPAETRAGKWNTSTDFVTIAFEVDPAGTALTSAIIEYKCSSGPVTFSETITLNITEKGIPIKNNKFVIELPGAEFKLTGKFNGDNTKVSGTLNARSCSGKWEASR